LHPLIFLLGYFILERYILVLRRNQRTFALHRLSSDHKQMIENMLLRLSLNSE